MPRLLLVAYYFPPLGGSGVQRVAKLAKYLPAHGWAVDVLTARAGTYVARDEGLRAEVEAAGVRVVETASFDPTRWVRAGQGGTVAPPSETRRTRLARLSQSVFVPDNKVGWLPFALRAGRRMLRADRYDAVLASAPPYTGLLAGRLLARAARLPFVVDLRDDWLGNPRHTYPTAAHRRLHAALERGTLRGAAAVLTISDAMRDAVAARHPDLADRLHVVPQGFDAADFAGPLPARTDRKFRLLYTGVFYDAQRPDGFLEGLARFLAVNPGARADVDARFAGLVPPDFDERVGRLGLADVVRYDGYLPHDAVVRAQRSADVLWMTVGEGPGQDGISTGKLYEYLGAGPAILGLVPEGTARRTLHAVGAEVAPPSDPAAGAAALGRLYDRWRAGALRGPSAAAVAPYERKRLAGVVAGVLDAVVSADPHPPHAAS